MASKFLRVVRYYPRTRLKPDALLAAVDRVGRNPYRHLLDDECIRLAEVRIMDSPRDAKALEHAQAAAKGYIPVELTFRRFLGQIGSLKYDFADVLADSTDSPLEWRVDRRRRTQ